MKALIDGDILLYSIGSATNDEGHPLSWPLTLARLDGKIHQIVREAGADDYIIYITGEGNFRKDEATIKPYKGNRNQPKPHHYERIKQYFRSTSNHKVEFVDGYEADDAMSIEQWADYSGILAPDSSSPEEHGTIICSIDKDLDMVPGWHFKWSRSGKEYSKYFVSETEGIHWFYTQLLMGDGTDNIPGLYNWGPAKSKKLIEGLEDELDLYICVREMYERYFGSYWKMFMHENARLLWMLREPEDDIRDRFCDLDKKRQERFKEEEDEF